MGFRYLNGYLVNKTYGLSLTVDFTFHSTKSLDCHRLWLFRLIQQSGWTFHDYGPFFCFVKGLDLQ